MGSYVDAYPVHILTEQSLAAMAERVPGTDSTCGDSAQPF